MQVGLEDVLNEYRDHTKFTTDDLLMHKAALKNAEKQINQLQSRVTELEAENATLKTED